MVDCEPNPAGVRGVVTNRLDHQVRIESFLVQCFFHQTKSFHGSGVIELAVHSSDISTWQWTNNISHVFKQRLPYRTAPVNIPLTSHSNMSCTSYKPTRKPLQSLKVSSLRIHLLLSKTGWEQREAIVKGYIWCRAKYPIANMRRTEVYCGCPGYRRVKRIGVILISSKWDAFPSNPPAFNSRVPLYTPKKSEALWEQSKRFTCLPLPV